MKGSAVLSAENSQRIKNLGYDVPCDFYWHGNENVTKLLCRTDRFTDTASPFVFMAPMYIDAFIWLMDILDGTLGYTEFKISVPEYCLTAKHEIDNKFVPLATGKEQVIEHLLTMYEHYKKTTK